KLSFARWRTCPALAVVAGAGAGLVPPGRPHQHLLIQRPPRPGQPDQQPAHLWHRRATEPPYLVRCGRLQRRSASPPCPGRASTRVRGRMRKGRRSMTCDRVLWCMTFAVLVALIVVAYVADWRYILLRAL